MWVFLGPSDIWPTFLKQAQLVGYTICIRLRLRREWSSFRKTDAIALPATTESDPITLALILTISLTLTPRTLTVLITLLKTLVALGVLSCISRVRITEVIIVLRFVLHTIFVHSHGIGLVIGDNRPELVTVLVVVPATIQQQAPVGFSHSPQWWCVSQRTLAV